MKMNASQEKALWIGTIVIVIMLLIPHWKQIPGFEIGRFYSPMNRYYFIMLPPSGRARIDSTQLFIQCVAVALVTAMCIYARRNRP